MVDNDGRDYLTGLYNRRWLFEDCPVCDSSGQFSIIYMDLDNFKAVNDLYGHEDGDRVLKITAEAIRESEADGFPIRMSGDEFVLLLEGERSRDELTAIYERIVKKIGRAQRNDPGLALISISAGIVSRENERQSLQDVLGLGDDTMYEAKHSGKRRCIFYEDIREKLLYNKTIGDEAPAAVEADQFELCLNPLLNMQNGMLEMTRVLAYWHRPDGTVLKPGDYRPVLEANGYARMLDIYLLDKLFRHLGETDYSEILAGGIRFSIELSWLHFLDSRLEDALGRLSAKYGVPLSAIDIAVSEQALTARDTDRLVFGMSHMAEQGISLSIKNFGANFVSIRHLNSMPVQTFLLDSAWLSENIGDSRGRKLIKSIIRLTKDAHKQIIAIGYDDKLDRRFLAGCGCDACGDMSGDSTFELKAYRGYVKDKISKNEGLVYDFRGNLMTNNNEYPGSIIGDGITYISGVSDRHGGIHFSGGEIGENVVELPGALFPKDSYTIALWVYPEKKMNWSSAVYARYDGGFISFVPYTSADDGISVFRISVDNEGFFDITTRAIRLNEWSHMCFAYDAKSESVRSYINGRKGPLSQMSMPVMIGCRQVLLGGDPFQRSYVGSISSLCIYNYALSDREAEHLYQSYAAEPGFCGSSEEYWMDTK